MGVPGLWEIIQEAGHSRALVNIAIEDGFEANTSGVRGYRAGIDASLWYFHAENSTDAGTNPELRLLAFRCFRLLATGIIPLFMFDGRERPDVKRGNRKGKKGTHWLQRDFTDMLDCFGMEWRVARGEAEAELAYLNKIGVIDAVITDDVDTFLFGGRTVIRNMSMSLSGNKKHPARDRQGKESKFHAYVFEADAIETNRNVRMSRGGMVLFALLCGGDYNNNKAIRNISHKTAQVLAHLKYGDDLLSAYAQGPDHLRTFLPGWRTRLNHELQTNASGLLPGRKDITLPATFPDLHILDLYLNPVTNARTAANGTEGLMMRENGNPSLRRLAAFCEAKFDDWGGEKGILKRFANLLYNGVTVHLLRRAALEADQLEKTKRLLRGDPVKITGPLKPTPQDAVGVPAALVKRYLDPVREERAAQAFVNRAAPVVEDLPLDASHPLLVKIIKMRTHVETDFSPEYYVHVDPVQLVQLVSSGFRGPQAQAPPNGGLAAGPAPSQTLALRAADFDPQKPIKFYVSASMLRQVHPQLIEDYEARKNKRAAPRGGGRARGRMRAVALVAPGLDEDEEEDEAEVEDLTGSPARPVAGSQRGGAPRNVAASGPARRVAASSPVRAPPTRQAATVPASQPVAAAARPPTPVRIPRQPVPAPLARAAPASPPREVKVKQERAPAGQPNATPGGLPNSQPVASSAGVTLQRPAMHHHAPPAPPLQPYLPPPPREFYNVGLIETEERVSDRHFLFTFTDPDDPRYMLVNLEDRDEPMDLNPAEVTMVDRKPAVAQPAPMPVARPPAVAGPSDTLSRPASRQPQPRPQPQPQPQPPAIVDLEAEEIEWEQLPPFDQPQNCLAVPAPATVVPPAAAASSQRAAPARRANPTDHATSQPDHDLNDQEDPSGFSNMIDQILGVIPGARKRKRMTATERKRLLADIAADRLAGPSGSRSQPAKRRRTTAATGRVSPPGNQVSGSRVTPPSLPQPPVASGSASQPAPQSIARFPDLPPLSQPARPTPRSQARSVSRTSDVVVIVSSDDDSDVPAASGSLVPRKNLPLPTRAGRSGATDFLADVNSGQVRRLY